MRRVLPGWLVEYEPPELGRVVQVRVTDATEDGHWTGVAEGREWSGEVSDIIAVILG